MELGKREKEMKGCYLSRNYKNLNGAGNKAKSDIERIMDEMGFRNVGLRRTTYRNTVLAFLMTLLGVLKAPFCLRKGDVLVLQYPLKKYFTVLCMLAHWRGAKVVTLIHDLGSFRRKKLTPEKEIKRLSHADYIIAHNQHMKAWLLEQGCPVLVGELGIFDFLSEARCKERERPLGSPYRVIYAGALNYRKNTFLYEVGAYVRDFDFVLYGSGFERDKAKGKERMAYKGFVKSDELIATADGDFGLVWDGFSVSTCSGDFGEYLRYNNPHKTSLYLRCGLPVIIWNQAALADFIREHRAGLCVDSLERLGTILASLSPEAYQEMKRNALLLGERIANGYYCREALERAIEALKGS